MPVATDRIAMLNVCAAITGNPKRQKPPDTVHGRANADGAILWAPPTRLTAPQLGMVLGTRAGRPYSGRYGRYSRGGASSATAATSAGIPARMVAYEHLGSSKCMGARFALTLKPYNYMTTCVAPHNNAPQHREDSLFSH